MGLLSSLYTGSGYWNPLAWVLAMAVAAAVVYLIWRRGDSSYKKGTMQSTPFLKRIHPTTDMEFACRQADYFMEAVQEILERKQQVHRQADQ